MAYRPWRPVIATTEDDAIAAARSIGFPVVLKLHSKTITHKTDVGGVQLDLTTDEAVRSAYHASSRRSGSMPATSIFKE